MWNSNCDIKIEFSIKIENRKSKFSTPSLKYTYLFQTPEK